MKRIKIPTTVLVTALLAACGGGGGGSDTSTPTSTTFAVDTAYTKVMTTATSLNGTAVDGADTYTMNLSTTPAADEIFEGVLRKKASQSLTMKKNGAVILSSSYDQYFSVSPFESRGSRGSDGSYSISITRGLYSNTAKIGDSGSIDTTTSYTNSTKSTIVTTSESTWNLESGDNSSTANACTNTVVKNSSGIAVSSGSGCFKIDSAGNVLGMKYTLAVSGKTLVFR